MLKNGNWFKTPEAQRRFQTKALWDDFIRDRFKLLFWEKPPWEILKRMTWSRGMVICENTNERKISSSRVIAGESNLITKERGSREQVVFRVKEREWAGKVFCFVLLLYFFNGTWKKWKKLPLEVNTKLNLNLILI